MAYTFIKAQGHEIGKSLLEEDKIELAKSFMEKAKEKGVNFYMPIDAVIADQFADDANTKNVSLKRFLLIGKHLILDRKRLSLYGDVIQNSKLVIWNGPMGVFELDHFR